MIDPGPELVDRLFGALMVDEAWSERTPRGFTWWPHEFAQHIRVGQPIEDDGVVGCRVHVETDALAGLPAGGAAELDDTLVSLMRFPPMAGFCRGEGRVRLWSGVFIEGERAPFLVARLAVAAVLQATYAELGAEGLVEATRLSADRSAHPRSGRRVEPDEMLRLAGARIVPEGDAPSRWDDGEECVAIARELGERGARALAEPRGLNARFPFRKPSGTEDAFSAAGSSLLQVRNDVGHPELGNGVFVRLFLPSARAGGGSLADMALRLNELEKAQDDFTLASLGSWCLAQSEPEKILYDVLPAPARIAHVSFLPNVLFSPGTLRNVVMEAGRRALWAAHLFTHAGEFDAAGKLPSYP
ncbi:MAG: hypothetical protein ABIT01_04140 [Thermoanaerobaculia bacterium]